MAHFKPAFLDFFKNLAKNNNTEWFNENRKVYEKEVKKPFADFVEEMISRINKFEPEIKIKPSDAITRINKDIRFSKDKTPYNLHVAANISVYGKKNKAYPGFYFSLGPEGINIFGGAYMLEKEQLDKLRKLIAKQPAEFEAAINDKEFVNRFGKIQGEVQKRIDAEFKPLIEKQPLLANKQFYYSTKLDAETITNPKLAEVLMDYYNAAIKVNNYLKQGF